MARKKKSTKQYVRDLGWSLFVVPVALMPFFIYFAIRDPRVIIEDWQVYVLFFGLPWTLGFVVLRYSRTIPESPPNGEN